MPTIPPIPNEVIEYDGQYYVLAGSALADDRTQILKNGNSFAVFDRHGDIQSVGASTHGIYHHCTRFLSRLVLQIAGRRPLLLSTTIRDDNSCLAIDITNPDYPMGNTTVERGTIHILQTKFLLSSVCYQSFTVTNHSLADVNVPLELHLGADFADLFEVRGAKRSARGETLPSVILANGLEFRYMGRDRLLRRTRIQCSPAPVLAMPSHLTFNVRVKRKSEANVTVSVAFETEDSAEPRVHPAYNEAFEIVSQRQRELRAERCDIYTSNEQFNDWLNRSYSDLQMMITETPYGPYPYAGVPWYSTVFGRDGLITALQMLWTSPSMAKGVLHYLAAEQATAVEPERDAEPGKILHETREGEMAALGEIAFGRYYGSVDSTLLFVLLAGHYYRRTGDIVFVEEIWPCVERALTWMNTYGDPDKDGFIEYMQKSSLGLSNQGWKDSYDSVFYADGRLAEGPIALCEVQAYAYGALVAASELAKARNDFENASKLTRQATSLRRKFEQDFWCEELSCYALALDGQKKQCAVLTSNTGQCLLTGIASNDRAKRIAMSLTQPNCFSGWGVKTLASSEVRYNPMSYHNGSVWPHDNSLIAAGMARYGLQEHAQKLLTGMFDASIFMPRSRIPELFCGFERRPEEGPTLYPVACLPQAWAAGSVFLILQACMGLDIDGVNRHINFRRPTLPPWLSEVYIKALNVGDDTVDIRLHRYREDVCVEVSKRKGSVDVNVYKGPPP